MKQHIKCVPPGNPRRESALTAFTLVELLVIIVLVGVFSVLLLPVLARTRPVNHTLVCQNNMRQLMSAMQLYGADNHDWLPPNEDSGGTGNWVTGDMTSLTDATNSSYLTNSSSAKLANYTGPAPALYRCPSDSSQVSIAGKPYSRVRSVSMSQAVGSKIGTIAPVDGPWLDGSHGNVANSPWRTYGRFADMVAPLPGGLWVLIDEHPLSINDGSFGVIMANNNWIDFAATYHNFGAGIAFADGHVELRKWQEASTLSPNPPFQTTATHPTDLNWLQARTSVRYR